MNLPLAHREIGIEGMTCASCVRRVETALRAVPGVDAASVNLATERAAIDGRSIDFGAIAGALRAAGYKAVDLDSGPKSAIGDHQAVELQRLGRDVAVAAGLTVPVVAIGMAMGVPPIAGWVMAHAAMTPANLLLFALTTAVLFGPGFRIFDNGIRALLRLAPDMNSLVVLGTGAAYLYSALVTFWPSLLPLESRSTYYESAAAITTLILLGRYLERRAKGRSGAAIARLVGLQAKSARVARAGTVVEVPLEEVVRGDRVVLRPGDRVPVDGRVVEGASYVDESMITGEPAPVAKAAGADVVGGTINRNGTLTILATRVGANTMLGDIIRMVERAQADKLPVQAAIDKLTQWFVPAVIAAALLTFLAWLAIGGDAAVTRALTDAVAVLIVACPCAMGLATPISIVVGTGRAAELGVLFRKGDALQRLAAVTTIAFDKTGTLTVGRPEVTDVHFGAGVDEAKTLALVAAAEAHSEHPFAEAVVRYSTSGEIRLAKADRFEAFPGNGVTAVMGGHMVHVGAGRFMTGLGFDLAQFSDVVAALVAEGRSPIYAAVDGRVAVVMAVSDPPKASAAAVVTALHAAGLRVAMITGDHASAAAAVASRLGVDEVIADVLPAGKVAAIDRLRTLSGPVAFVGDGINDAPALAAADVGIAVGSGTDIAIESADVVLLGSDLTAVGRAVAISRASMRNIRQNLFWAFAYNIVLIPIAAGVLAPVGIGLSPILAGAAMAASSVFVVSNALRLHRFGRNAGAAAAMRQPSPVGAAP